MWPTQEPPCRFQITCFQISRFARFSQSVNLLHLALDMAMVPFQFFSCLFTDPTPVRCNWSVFARKMHSTSKFAMTVLSKCVRFLLQRSFSVEKCTSTALYPFGEMALCRGACLQDSTSQERSAAWVTYTHKNHSSSVERENTENC